MQRILKDKIDMHLEMRNHIEVLAEVYIDYNNVPVLVNLLG